MEKDWTKKAVSAEEAVGLIQSGMNVFVHGAAATPTPLIEALAARRDLESVRLWHLHTNGPAPFADPGRAVARPERQPAPVRAMAAGRPAGQNPGPGPVGLPPCRAGDRAEWCGNREDGGPGPARESGTELQQRPGRALRPPAPARPRGRRAPARGARAGRAQAAAERGPRLWHRA